MREDSRELARVLLVPHGSPSVSIELLTGPLTGIYDPTGMGSMLFAILAVAAQLDRDCIREKTLEGQAAAAARGNHGGRPVVIDPDSLLFARVLRDAGTPVPEIAKKLTIKTGKNAGEAAVMTLTSLGAQISALGSGGATTDVYRAYMQWVGLAVSRLRFVVGREDLERLVLTRRHWALCGITDVSGASVREVLSAEIEDL